jgi:tetratricopeptide (TPR) repeat protein
MKHRRLLPAAARQVLVLSLVMLGMGLRSVTAKAQACSEDQNEIAMNYSLYYEDFKNGNFETALPYLRWILRCAPTFPSGRDTNFRRAVEVYEGIAMKAASPEEQRVYLDSALYVFDTSMTNLQDAGIQPDSFYWYFEKGRFIQNHATELPDVQGEVGPIYETAFGLDPTRLQTYYINYIIADFVQKDDKGSAVDFMDQVESHRADDQEVTDLLAQWRGQLFTSPEERIGFLEGQLEKNPEDADVMAELFELLMDEGHRDRVYELAPAMMAIDPSARTYRLIGKMRLEDGQVEEAIRLYEESLSLPGGPEGARESYYNIGIAHQQEGRLSRARTAFRQSLDADPAYGASLIAIGDLYVSAVQGCGTFEREDRAVYWLAADYYERAAARGSAPEAAQARSRLAQIQRYMPTAEDKFFKGWTGGDSYTIDYGCYTWIGESTRIR